MQKEHDQFVASMQQNSYLTDGNSGYIESIYDAYLRDPSAVDPYWRNYFEKLHKVNGTETDIPLSDVRDQFIELAKLPAARTQQSAALDHKQIKVYNLINAYRELGHREANLDPLKMKKNPPVPELSLSFYGLTEADLDKSFDAGDFVGATDSTLRSIIAALRETYCGTIAAEYMYISDPIERDWIRTRLETARSHPTFSSKEKIHILDHLIDAEGLEKYLAAKYVGQKRFSVEGGVSLIPMLDHLVNKAGSYGVQELIIGMAHRGRLNVLVNIIGRPPELLFQEFEDKQRRDELYSGDVKYHRGFSSNVKTPDGVVHLALAFNPSHLEIIDPVVVGSVRARQERRGDVERQKVIPLLIHGDAAFSGQGVVMETFAMSLTRGFTVGGTVHIVINNQIGFTTSNPLDSRSSLYCTDIAKMVSAPVFHVNGDDPEACVFVTQLAFEYRMKFKKDVVVDLVCYRRYGHNEADEPAATQPLMYNKIRSYSRTNELYADKLIREGVVTQAYVDKKFTEYRDALDKGKTLVEVVPKGQGVKFLANWLPYKDKKWDEKINTSVSLKRLKALGKKLTTLPEGFVLQPQVEREYEGRTKMIAGEIPINWGCAEALAYASLLTEGVPIRLCGQDAGRGTFAHRHAVLYDYHNGKTYIPLQHLSADEAHFHVIDSLLSEEAVLGFEYGYAVTDPETLVIWEAQFGDFFNGAQVVVDQFISSGEQKWKRLAGITVFLPHGYEGQGPEHSSARLERFLQLCAQDNMQVCVPSTPAQHFHMIRRQMLRPYRKPLIVMTPKSLLRHKISTSSLSDLADGKFFTVLGEVDLIAAEGVRKVILCCGKVYYDLLEKRRDKQILDVAIIRIEQLYPFPDAALKEELAKYPNAKVVTWTQEEPKNQGAWYSIEHEIHACLSKNQILEYAGRESSASPSTGYTSLHLQQQHALVEDALK